MSEVEIEMELLQEQYADLKKYIPKSDSVKIVFEDIVGYAIDDWEEEIERLMSNVLIGDKDALFDLLELTYLNAHNEGMLESNNDLLTGA